MMHHTQTWLEILFCYNGKCKAAQCFGGPEGGNSQLQSQLPFPMGTQ